MQVEHARFASEQRLPRGFVLYALATILISTTWLWPHIVHFRHVPDRGDPIFSAWRLARFAHQLANDPWHLFDGNIFFPLPLTLTYSDATVLQGIVGAPLIWLGIEPLVVANALFFFAFPLCGLAFFYTGWRLTGDARAGFITGILGAWYPFHGEHYSHLELQWFMFVPIALLALPLVLARPTLRRGLLLGAGVGAQWLASMYLGVMLLTLLIPYGIAIALAWRCRPSVPLLRSLSAAALVVLTCMTTALPYMASRASRGDRALSSLGAGSAFPSNYADTHRRMAAYPWRSRVANHPERELHPGISTVLLALGGIVIAPTAITVALVCGAVAAFDWSLGVNGVTYQLLYEFVLPYRGIRVPARFSVLLGSCLILLGGFGVSSVLSRLRPKTSNIAFAAVAIAVILDLRMTTVLVEYWSTVPAIYQDVRADMVLAEFPAGHAIDYMYFSTTHWARLVGGYSGYIPVDSELDSASMFPSAAALASLRERGATHLTYNCAFERSPERCVHTLTQLDSSALIDVVSTARWNGTEVRLYKLVDVP